MASVLSTETDKLFEVKSGAISSAVNSIDVLWIGSLYQRSRKAIYNANMVKILSSHPYKGIHA